MATQWFCKIEDQDFGPITLEQLTGMATGGQLQPEHLVRKGEQGRWVAAAQVQGLFGNSKSQVPAAPKRTSDSPKRTSDSSSSNMNLRVAQPLAQPAKPAAAPRAAAPRAAAPPPRKPAAVPPSVAAPPPPRGSPAQIPVGIPVGVAVPSRPSAASVSNGSAAVSGEHGVVRPRKRGPNIAVILGVGAAVCIVLGVAIGAAINFSHSKPGAADDQAVAANTAGNATDPELAAANDPASVRPAGANGQPSSSQEKSGAGEGESATSNGAPVPSAALADISKSINKWYEAPKTIAGVKNVVRLQILSAWLSADPAGGPSPSSDDESPSQYLFMEVQITNASANEALAYTSWNGGSPATDKVAALLFDGSGGQCRLVPAAKAPAEGRQRSLKILPGDVVKDVLVFEMPAERSQSLQLALPMAALGRDGYFGFELPADLLAERTAAPPPQVAAETPPPEARPDPIALAVESDPPEAAAPEPVTKPVPLTFDDLKRSIEKSAGQSPDEKKALSDAEQKELDRLRESVKKQP